MDRAEMLKSSFPGLTDELVTKMLAHVREATYPAGVVLCHEGEREETFYYIVEGQVEILKWMEFTKENRHMRVSNAGNFFGEMGLISDAPRGATVRTTQQTTVLEMSRSDFLHLLSASPSMALAMVRTTIDRLRENDRMQFDELRKTYEALQKLDQAKLDFIEVAAHELRTPLTVIRGYGKVIALTLQSDQNMQEVVKGLQDGVSRMLDVVNAMLDVSKIDSQILKVSKVPVLPKLIANEALSGFNEALKERRIKVEQEHEAISLPFIYADPVLMNKLFFQLISNAIKYTPDGGKISIITRETHDSRIGHGIEIIIKDSGVGIKPEAMQHIFQKFYQGGDVSLHSSSKTAYLGGGPGLGLAISRGIVEAHNGVIWAESDGFDTNTHPGAAFHVLLPVNAPENGS